MQYLPLNKDTQKKNKNNNKHEWDSKLGLNRCAFPLEKRETSVRL